MGIAVTFFEPSKITSTRLSAHPIIMGPGRMGIDTLYNILETCIQNQIVASMFWLMLKTFPFPTTMMVKQNDSSKMAYLRNTSTPKYSGPTISSFRTRNCSPTTLHMDYRITGWSRRDISRKTFVAAVKWKEFLSPSTIPARIFLMRAGGDTVK